MKLETLKKEIIACGKCTRLRNHCKTIARVKKRAFQNEEYWGKPVAGFGDPNARLLIVGLAPAAHGANRTGRMFTGDQSGLWLYRALHRSGFANQAESVRADDGLRLNDAFITAISRCAPPDNKPLPKEIENCSSFLDRELEILKNVKVYLALGRIAYDGIWPKISGGRKKPAFSHGFEISLENGKTLLLSYHPSQQNTFTGRLTEPMFDSIFSRAQDTLIGI